MSMELINEMGGAEKTEWTGRYKGIGWMIRKSPPNEYGDVWCYYIFIHSLDVPPALHAEIFTLEWSDWLRSLPWHYGMTFHQLTIQHRRNWETHEFEPYITVQAGCDYQHIWDEGQRYTADDILPEVQETIDALVLKIEAATPTEGA